LAQTVEGNSAEILKYKTIQNKRWDLFTNQNSDLN
jgi:hypothetical protein